MLFISPPFGNYFNLPYTKSIVGSVTLEPRPDLFSQIYNTLYYSYQQRGWVNCIGLRNPGLAHVLSSTNLTNKVLSLAIMHPNDVDKMNRMIPNDQALEVNISCPNVHHTDVKTEVAKFLNPERKWCSIKLSPLATSQDIAKLYEQGFRQFHCSNTLPVSDGGLSGKSLIPYTYRAISQLQQYPDVDIVAGGGVTCPQIIDLYRNHGAHHVSVSSLMFNPLYFGYVYLQWVYQTKCC